MSSAQDSFDIASQGFTTTRTRADLDALLALSPATARTTQRDVTSASHRLATASSDADVAEALAIMGQPEPPNWVELYKVYEIIEHTGLLKAAMGAAGVSANQMSLLTRTACHPVAGGPGARHGRSRQDPPSSPPLARWKAGGLDAVGR